MTEDEALQICRNPERSIRDAKSVLRWAASDPTPDKIPLLLLLNSDAFAAVKKLYSDLEEILTRCAEGGSSALWNCVEHDWSLDRHYIALSVLLKLPLIDTERLIRLARNRLPPPEWGWIARWAESTGFTLPPHVVEQQDKWKRELYHSDSISDNAYTDLGRRKPFWPADKDLGLPPAKPPAPRSPGYGEASAELTEVLNRILIWMNGHDSNLGAGLHPGLTANQVSAQVGALPFTLPEEAFELYRWRNGARGERPVTLVPYFWFMPLEEAIRSYRSCRDLPGFRKNWFPLFDFNGDEAICLECGKAEAATAPVIRHDYESGPEKVAGSLTELMRRTAESYESGRYTLNEHRRIVEKH
jgi:cell wall assembly regulator SMI1